MKKYFLYGILSVLGLIVVAQGTFAGQYYKPHTNRLGVWTDLGANIWMMQKGELKTSIGGGLGLGMVYEFQQDHFLLNLGVGANMMYNPVKVNNLERVLFDQDDIDPLYGPTGEKVDYYYTMKDRKDKYLNVQVQVPVMLGYGSDDFFFLVGAKFGYMINVQTFCDAPMETKGYNHTIGWMQNMPMYQFYPERTKSDKMRCAFNPDVAVSLEIGGYVGERIKGTGYNRFRKPRHFRVSGFVDYGLLSINKATMTDPIIMPEKYVAPSTYDMVEATSLKDAISSNAAGKLNNLFVGVKFTALFDLPQPGECILCNRETRFIPRPVKHKK